MRKSMPSDLMVRFKQCDPENKNTCRVMYRYLNKGNALTGTVECVYDHGVMVKMDDGKTLIRDWKSWEII